MSQSALSRRTLLAAGVTVALAPALARAQESGFAIDWQGGEQTPAVVDSLAAQIALVRALRIKPDIAAFFAAQPITVDLATGTATRAGPRGIFFERRPMPHDNPVLLHELLHRYHWLRLPQGRANPDILRFFDQVKAGGRYPLQAYMFTNPSEFFAMCASVVLHGRAARPPSTRASMRANAPEFYRWVVDEFGLVAG